MLGILTGAKRQLARLGYSVDRRTSQMLLASKHTSSESRPRSIGMFVVVSLLGEATTQSAKPGSTSQEWSRGGEKRGQPGDY